MELPFLKNNKNQGGGGPLERTASPTRENDDMDDGLIDQVAGEFFQAIEKKDKALLKEALTALVLHIQDQDQMSDTKEGT